MNKRTLGILLGLFFGIFGLLGLNSSDTKEDKDAFMSGWWLAFVINIVFYAVIFLIYAIVVAGLYA